MTRKQRVLVEEDLSYKIRGAVFEVHRHLGSGFLESVYEKALLVELDAMGLHVEAQVPLGVTYEAQPVGKFYADIVVEKSVIIELKAQDKLNMDMGKAQLINYLKASGLRLGLLVNFSFPKARVERVVL